jgi:hypothetical protein
MDSAASILRFLDDAFERIEMPCLSNLNVDYLCSRMSAYRGPDTWLLIFNSVVWWPAADGLMAMVETVGPGAIGKQGFDNDRAFAPASLRIDEPGQRVAGIAIRGRDVDPGTLRIAPRYDLQPELGFWAAVAMLDQHRDELLASAAELARFIPGGFRHLLTMDEWEHPTFDTPASRTESFPLLAAVLEQADPSLWRPAARPNTHWSHWFPK